jgi:hypothetical protein
LVSKAVALINRNNRFFGTNWKAVTEQFSTANLNLYRTVSNLPMITDEFREQLESQNDNNEPSCSLTEALEKQDLFINSTLANMSASLLYRK